MTASGALRPFSDWPAVLPVSTLFGRASVVLEQSARPVVNRPAASNVMHLAQVFSCALLCIGTKSKPHWSAHAATGPFFLRSLADAVAVCTACLFRPSCALPGNHHG